LKNLGCTRLGVGWGRYNPVRVGPEVLHTQIKACGEAQGILHGFLARVESELVFGKEWAVQADIGVRVPSSGFVRRPSKPESDGILAIVV
jgi:hypothetical protein